MVLFKLSSGDKAGFKLLFALVIMYALISALVHAVIRMKFITPLGADAPLDRFSEARAVEHVRVLSEDIGGRQEGTPGLRQAAQYIRTQLEKLKERAGPNVRIEIEETTVNGSFTMMFIGHSISLAYRDVTNIIMRISSAESQDGETSVLVNGHYDSAVGSPGAGDCGSCVASMLELARLTTDSGWVPPKPVIFLFNGAEELFMLGSHGFMTTYKWRDTIGAFIDIEASGTGGFDLVCQSGPGSWPSKVYAQSALHPMGNSAAQDIFGAVPGDTDYRMFAEDYGDIPGLDTIFLLGGYYYHTSSDTVERLLPGSLQARGENLHSLIKAFTNSSKLQNANERKSLGYINASNDDGAIFFDYFSLFLVYYSKNQAQILHTIPVVIYLLMPLILRFPSHGVFSSALIFFDFIKGMFYQAAGIVLAIIFPVIFAVLRLLFCGHSMNWFANPYLAFMMFVPSSVAGMLIPSIVPRRFPLSQDVSMLKLSKEELVLEARFWGAFGLYSLLTLAYLLAGLGGGFVTLIFSVFMIPAWILFRLSVKGFGQQSLRSTACYVIPMIPCLMYSAYFGGFLAAFLIEKMGMTGSHPPPYGFFVPDVLVAATIGVVTGWSVGPILPVIGHRLARSSIMQFLLHTSIVALALSSQFFPYSTDAPKRVILQHTIRTADGGQILEASYDLSVVDSNSLLFVFKNAPEVAKELHINPELSLDNFDQSHQEDWMGIFPISALFSRSIKFPANSESVLKQFTHFPHIKAVKPQVISSRGSRRIHLELTLGSLREVWVAVLNVTGPLSSWSFADGTLPAPESISHGPPSYICRLSGASHKNWTFWLEARSSEEIRVDVAVVEQYIVEPVKKLKGLFPNWMDVTAFSSFMSTYKF